MEIRNPQPRHMWFGAAALFALSGIVALAHQDAFAGLWIALASLAIIIAFRSETPEAPCISAHSTETLAAHGENDPHK